MTNTPWLCSRPKLFMRWIETRSTRSNVLKQSLNLRQLRWDFARVCLYFNFAKFRNKNKNLSVITRLKLWYFSFYCMYFKIFRVCSTCITTCIRLHENVEHTKNIVLCYFILFYIVL